MEINELKEMSQRMRKLSIDMAYKAGKKGAHLGGGLSAIEILAVLYGEILKVDSKNPCNQERDIFLLGKGHGVLAYYSALYEKGFLSKDDIDSFEQPGSNFIGHPVKNIKKGIEYSSGSLGMALSVGVGMAISAKHRNSSRNVYVVLGDGECQEGSVWEALFLAAKYKLSNLTIVIDNNRVQSDGFTESISGFSDLGDKLKVFGCEIVEINGHDVEELVNAFNMERSDKPRAIIANTIKGKGVSFMENDYRWHHSALNEEQYEKAVSEIVGRKNVTG